MSIILSLTIILSTWILDVRDCGLRETVCDYSGEEHGTMILCMWLVVLDSECLVTSVCIEFGELSWTVCTSSKKWGNGINFGRWIIPWGESRGRAPEHLIKASFSWRGNCFFFSWGWVTTCSINAGNRWRRCRGGRRCQTYRAVWVRWNQDWRGIARMDQSHIKQDLIVDTEN